MAEANGRFPENPRRIVVKVGTNVLTAGTNRLNLAVMAQLVGQVAALHREGKQLILVTSGAIAAGRQRLGVRRDRRDIPFRQVMAAVGQSRLMYAYDLLFGWHDIVIAQTLLTRADLADRDRYLNARNTLLALLDLGVVPIVNENDVVAVDEIRETRFGDNDTLSALVANLVDADLLIILTDIAGLYTADPKVCPDARLIPVVERVDEQVEAVAGGVGSERGTGGMATKIQAARLATAGGTAVVIADGREPDIVLRVVAGEPVGTRFLPAATRLESRKRWMLSGLSTRGEVVVDAGAVEALRCRGKSLLPAGVREVRGDFDRGDVVNLVGPDGEVIGCGIVNYSAADLCKIKGVKSEKIGQILGYAFGAEVVHRNNLVLF